MPDCNWYPSASWTVLQQRATILDGIRSFFKKRGILEVETPLLSSHTVTDVHIDSITTTDDQFLQTSPEFAMKRLLAAGSGAIFQISKAFRHREFGRHHHAEFSLLEWYRPDFNHHQLMDELDELLQQVFSFSAAQRLTYQNLFEQYLGINPHQVTSTELQQLAVTRDIAVTTTLSDKDDWLNLLFSYLIEPQLQQPTFVYDYPSSQAALAQVHGGVAQRFELYIQGIEIANGFHELTDMQEQQQRFEYDQQQRQQRGLKEVLIDPHLLAALAHGLPHCAGVAVGIDRLLMVALGVDRISQVLSFATE